MSASSQARLAPRWDPLVLPLSVGALARILSGAVPAHVASEERGGVWMLWWDVSGNPRIVAVRDARPNRGAWQILGCEEWFGGRPICYVPRMAKTRSSAGIQLPSDLGF